MDGCPGYKVSDFCSQSQCFWSQSQHFTLKFCIYLCVSRLKVLHAVSWVWTMPHCPSFTQLMLNDGFLTLNLGVISSRKFFLTSQGMVSNNILYVCLPGYLLYYYAIIFLFYLTLSLPSPREETSFFISESLE